MVAEDVTVRLGGKNCDKEGGCILKNVTVYPNGKNSYRTSRPCAVKGHCKEGTKGVLHTISKEKLRQELEKLTKQGDANPCVKGVNLI